MNWTAITNLFSLASNVAQTVLVADGIEPAGIQTLTTGLQSAILPFVQALQGRQPAQVDIMAGYGALIGSLGAVKAQAGLPQATLDKVTEYIAAAEAGTTAYLAEMRGFDASLFVVAPPMTP